MTHARRTTLFLLLIGCAGAPADPTPQTTAQIDPCEGQQEDVDGFQDDDGCPDPDNDGDEIVDIDDLCPCVAEDRDAFEDQDGCPEIDNDRDAIADVCDSCPNDPENYNGQDDDDGCPDRALVRITANYIQVIERVYFEKNSAALRNDFDALLDAITAVMQGNPQLHVVAVHGHASAGERRPRRLGQMRADVVREALIERGVDPSRLVARSDGAQHPIAPNDTPANRERNRRVELEIEDIADTPELRGPELPPRPPPGAPGCPDGEAPPTFESVC